jgi:putative SOS response-associated peptidase YedK
VCGRYASMRDTADLILLTGATDETGEDDQPQVDPVRSANVAPTDRARVLVLEDGRLVLRRHAWGLIPPWSKGPEGAARMVNARIETIADKPSYRRAVRTSRCLFPADAWYEWQVMSAQSGKQERRPHLVRRADGGPLWLAGIWTHWHPQGGGAAVASAAIVTGPAPQELSWLHERAPVAVPETMFSTWLKADGADPQPILDTLSSVGYPPLEWYPVSREIGQVRVKGAHLMEPVNAAPALEVTPITLF